MFACDPTPRADPVTTSRTDHGTGSPCTQSSNQAASSTASSSARRSRSIVWTSRPATPSRSSASCSSRTATITAIGRPVVDGATVSAQVLGQDRGDKIVVFKYKPKARTRVKKGFRAELTTLRITDIAFGGKSAAEDAEQAAKDEVKRARDAEKSAQAAAAKAAQEKAAADKELATKLAAAAEPAEAETKPKSTKKKSTAKKAADEIAADAENAPEAQAAADPEPEVRAAAEAEPEADGDGADPDTKKDE